MEEFKTKEELYKRTLPALKSKIKEFRSANINNIKEIDIWNYLTENSWKKRTNLQLFDIISDIFNLDINKLKDNTDEEII